MEINLRHGEAFFNEGKIEEAEKSFLTLLEGDPKNKEAYNNLGVIAFQNNQIEKAVEYFHESLKLDPFYKQAVLNYAYLLKGFNLIHQAIPFLEKITEKYPDDEDFRLFLDEAKFGRPPILKIAILCLPGFQSFLGDIVHFLKTKYEVRTCYNNNNHDIESAVRWADIVWLEWANELTIELTNRSSLFDEKRVICRLHSYEALDGHARNIGWEKIDDLIFVAEHIKNIALQQVPNLLDRVKNVSVIPNGINLDKIVFKDRAEGTNLAYLGHINYKKGPMLLLHAFRELVQVDKRYKLFIAGDFQDPRYDLYFNQMIKEMNLTDNIQMDGWVEDVATWLEDKQYIVCTSVLEGHPVGLMEAMACGLKPLIHHYVGAKEIYPAKYIWNTIPEFITMVLDDNYNSLEYRQFIEYKYSLSNQLINIERVLSSI